MFKVAPSRSAKEDSIIANNENGWYLGCLGFDARGLHGSLSSRFHRTSFFWYQPRTGQARGPPDIFKSDIIAVRPGPFV